MQLLAQTLMAQANKEVVAMAQTYKMNECFQGKSVLDNETPGIFASKVDKERKRFIERVYKVFEIMGVSSIKKVDIVAY